MALAPKKETSPPAYLSLSWLHVKTRLIQLLQIRSSLYTAEDVMLKLWDGLKRVWHMLVLLNLTNDFRDFGTLSKVDEVRLPDDRSDSVFNERQMDEVYI